MQTSQHYSHQQILDLESRLREAEDTLEAIREGSVDALVVKDRDQQQQVFTLRSADYTYRVLIESMSQGALTISEAGVILYSNIQFSYMVGTPLKNIIGHSIQSFVRDDDKEEMSVIVAQGAANVSGSERTIRLVGKLHKEAMVSARKLPAFGKNAYMCLVITDMTERKQAEYAKDEFISLASHQLRTPATGVKQYLGMLLEGYAGTLSDTQLSYIQTAYDSNERQLKIINSILKTAQIDFSAHQLKIQQHDMKVLIEEALMSFQPIIKMRQQVVSCHYDDEVRALVEPSEISLVICNLIENASKYSPEGAKIAINLAKDNDYIYLAITDHGVGIEPNDQAKIFEKFTRVNNTLSDTVSGTGLGLYWVKKIVELHNGSIELRSKLAVGSTFTIKLPKA